MCRICDGETREQLNAEAEMRIAVHGYTLQAVGDDEHQPWAYTVGLLDAVDHPELIIAGASVETSARILTAFADAVVEGDRYEVGETMRVPGRWLRFGAVHEIQYDLDTFAGWYELSEDRSGATGARRLFLLSCARCDAT